MNFDRYKEVINGEDTYKKIAQTLYKDGKCIIGWTDQLYDHRDILFTYRPKKMNRENLQRGLFWCQLYVSIIGCSCMGFLLKGRDDNRKSNGYIQEKLDLHDNHCDLKICELINGVIYYMDKLKGSNDD